MVLLRSRVRPAIWPLYIHFRICPDCATISTSLILVKFLRFQQQGLSVTGYYYSDLHRLWPKDSFFVLHSTLLIHIKFLRLQQQGLSVTGYDIQILLTAQNYISEVLNSTGIDFCLKTPSLSSILLFSSKSNFLDFNKASV